MSDPFTVWCVATLSYLVTLWACFRFMKIKPPEIEI